MTRDFKPDKNLSYSDKQLNFIRSQDKNKSIWQYLKRYQNINYTEKRLKKDYSGLDSKLVKIKASNIADCIRQADSYFNSAMKSDLAIKPLITYYGMLSLVKALVIFGDNNLTLDADVLKNEGLNKHGLSIGTHKNTNDVSIRDNSKNLLDEFCYAIGDNKTVLNLLHECWSKVGIAQDTKFTVGDLASMHPSSWRSFSKHTRKSPKYFPCDSSFRTTAEGYEHFIMFKGDFQFLTYTQSVVTGLKGNSYLEKRMPNLAQFYNRDTTYSPYGYRSKKIPTSLENYQPSFHSATGESFTMAQTNSGYLLHNIEVEYIMMFILGSLTRYTPQKWLKNVAYVGGDSMFVIEGFVNSALLSFPKQILEELDNQEYTFTGDSSYWG